MAPNHESDPAEIEIRTGRLSARNRKIFAGMRELTAFANIIGLLVDAIECAGRRTRHPRKQAGVTIIVAMPD